MDNSISELDKMFSESIKSNNITADSIYEIYKLHSETESETTFPPQTTEQIENWERIYNVVLPKEYREFLLLSDGLVSDIFGGELFSLNEIIPCSPIEEFSDKSKDYFIIGNYIGDGSMLLCNRNGNFYKFDHCYEPVESSLLDFLKHWYKKTVPHHNNEELQQILGGVKTIIKLKTQFRKFISCHREIFFGNGF